MMILVFIFGVVVTLFPLCVMTHRKNTQQNKVHFYVTRDKDESLWLYLGKPIREEESGTFRPNELGTTVRGGYHFEQFGLNINDYKDLKWEDEPVEVFLNLED